jgi:hypothetical protein
MVDRYATVECGCGASYSRREVTLPIKDIGSFECGACGHRLEIWYGRTVPIFTALPRKERKISVG